MYRYFALMIFVLAIWGCGVKPPVNPVPGVSSGVGGAEASLEVGRDAVASASRISPPQALPYLETASRAIGGAINRLADVSRELGTLAKERDADKAALASSKSEVAALEKRWSGAVLGGLGRFVALWLAFLGLLGIAFRIYGLMGLGFLQTISAWIGNALLALSIWGGLLIVFVFEPIYQKRYLTRKVGE